MSIRSFVIFAGIALVVLAIALFGLPTYFSSMSCGSAMDPSVVPLAALGTCQTMISNRETMGIVVGVLGLLAIVGGIVVRRAGRPARPAAGWIQRLATPIGDLKKPNPQQSGPRSSDAKQDLPPSANA